MCKNDKLQFGMDCGFFQIMQDYDEIKKYKGIDVTNYFLVLYH